MKKQHPIRKMQKRLYGVRSMPERVEREIARHVKPLLDALEKETERHVKPTDTYWNG